MKNNLNDYATQVFCSFNLKVNSYQYMYVVYKDVKYYGASFDVFKLLSQKEKEKHHQESNG